MTADDQKLNTVIAPVAMLNMVSLMKEINTVPGTWYAAIDMANESLHIDQKGGPEAVWIHLEQTTVHIHCFSLNLC